MNVSKKRPEPKKLMGSASIAQCTFWLGFHSCFQAFVCKTWFLLRAESKVAPFISLKRLKIRKYGALKVIRQFYIVCHLFVKKHTFLKKKPWKCQKSLGSKLRIECRKYNWLKLTFSCRLAFLIGIENTLRQPFNEAKTGLVLKLFWRVSRLITLPKLLCSSVFSKNCFWIISHGGHEWNTSQGHKI